MDRKLLLKASKAWSSAVCWSLPMCASVLTVSASSSSPPQLRHLAFLPSASWPGASPFRLTPPLAGRRAVSRPCRGLAGGIGMKSESAWEEPEGWANLASFSSSHGQMMYRKFGGSQPSPQPGEETILFLHGLTSGSYTAKPPSSLSSRVRFLVPDMFGHGDSQAQAVSSKTSYLMKSQAQAVSELLQAEGVSEVTVIAHSMGGPIGLELCEKLASSEIQVKRLVYAEGNLDEGDCFGSKKMAAAVPPAVNDSSSQEAKVKFGQWVCAVDLVDVSINGQLLDRLLKLRQTGLALTFVYGEKNRGRFSSESLLTDKGIEIEWIPNGGHSMHADGGAPTFWELVDRLTVTPPA